jgi:hypothetical protein
MSGNEQTGRLRDLFELLKERIGVVEKTEVGTVEHVRAWHEVIAIMREIETIIPPATEPL